MKTSIRTEFKKALKEVAGANYREQVRVMTEAVELIANKRNIKPYSITWDTSIKNN